MAWNKPAEQKRMDFSKFKLVGAPYGGPIAVTRDQKKLLLVNQGVSLKPTFHIYTSAGRDISSFEVHGACVASVRVVWCVCVCGSSVLVEEVWESRCARRLCQTHTITSTTVEQRTCSSSGLDRARKAGLCNRVCDDFDMHPLAFCSSIFVGVIWLFYYCCCCGGGGAQGWWCFYSRVVWRARVSVSPRYITVHNTTLTAGYQPVGCVPLCCLGRECKENGVSECIIWGSGLVALTNNALFVAVSNFNEPRPKLLVRVLHTTRDSLLIISIILSFLVSCLVLSCLVILGCYSYIMFVAHVEQSLSGAGQPVLRQSGRRRRK